MTLKEYENKAAETAIYEKRVIYPAVGLIGENGEAADKIKKIIRDSNGVATDDDKKHIALELGDTLWYCAMLLRDLGYSFDIIGKVTEIINVSGTYKKYKDMEPELLVISMSKYCAMASEAATMTHNYSDVIFSIANVVALISVLGGKYGYSLIQIGEMNIEKLSSRNKRNKIQGSGDDR